MQTYLLLKLVHLFAVILFMGNIITGLFWMRQADKTGNLAVISFAMKGIRTSDKWFTIPGVLIITAGGISAATHVGLPLLRTGWIFWALILFSVSGIIFGWKVAPLQKRIYKLTQAPPDQFDQAAYRRNLVAWEIWGLAALLTPLAAMVMMVLKLPARSVF